MNMFNSAHKATNHKYRQNYDKVFKESDMKYKKNYGASPQDVKRGFLSDDETSKPEVAKSSEGDASEEHDLRKILYDDEDGGFCGRAKGGER